IDECADASHNCDGNADCSNSVGSFSCSCHSGFSGDGVTCTEIDCGVPPDVAFASKTTSGTTFDSVTTYSCHASYVIASGSITSTCDASGQWTQTNLICVVDCGALAVLNGAAAYSSTLEGGTATVTCNNLFQYFGTSNTATCQSTGLWEGLDGACGQVEWNNEVGPFAASLPAPISSGWEMIFKGIPTGNFDVFLKDPPTTFLKMNVLFDQTQIIISTPSNSSFASGSFPFQVNTAFDIRLKLEGNQFKFTVDGTVIHTSPATTPENFEEVRVSSGTSVTQLKFTY
ncbi:sushi domain-containing protein 1-like, partial [Gigantopelta aegis]|uniref:sushi domain-containing protein 1-like n=1 Tax=Gigantopelta aegis TaxID=1735272 RepID=UPI001B88C879